MSPKENKKKRRSSTEDAEVGGGDRTIPDFQPIKPTLQNISEMLSIIGAHANVKKVSKEKMMKKTEVYGWIGAGDISSVLKYSDALVLVDDFVQLNEHSHGEIATAVVNVISGIPDVLQSSHKESHGQLKSDNKKLFIEAAFAQHFIFTKEGTPPQAVSEQSVLFSDEPTNAFCFACRENSIFLITADKCLDATEYFARKVWWEKNDEMFADFRLLLSDPDFENSKGRIFAILPDKKLQIAEELKKLRCDYTERFGSYENDTSLSAEDWDEISSLNASISEAESYELQVDERNNKHNSNTTGIADLSTVISEERYSLFQNIKNKERELWAEQERFKYSLIPGEDVEEARARFYETLPNETENANETRTAAKKKKTLTALRASTKGNS